MSFLFFSRSHRKDRCLRFLTLYVQLHFHVLWSTCQTCSYSKHESLYTNLRKYVLYTHSESSCSSLHCEQNARNQFVPIFKKSLFIWLRLGVSVSLENQYSKTIFNWLRVNLNTWVTEIWTDRHSKLLRSWHRGGVVCQNSRSGWPQHWYTDSRSNRCMEPREEDLRTHDFIPEWKRPDLRIKNVTLKLWPTPC